WPRRCILDRRPATGENLIGIFFLAQVEDGPRPPRWLLHVAPLVEPLLDQGVIVPVRIQPVGRDVQEPGPDQPGEQQARKHAAPGLHGLPLTRRTSSPPAAARRAGCAWG